MATSAGHQSTIADHLRPLFHHHQPPSRSLCHHNPSSQCRPTHHLYCSCRHNPIIEIGNLNPIPIITRELGLPNHCNFSLFGLRSIKTASSQEDFAINFAKFYHRWVFDLATVINSILFRRCKVSGFYWLIGFIREPCFSRMGFTIFLIMVYGWVSKTCDIVMCNQPFPSCWPY